MSLLLVLLVSSATVSVGGGVGVECGVFLAACAAYDVLVAVFALLLARMRYCVIRFC